MKNTLNIQNLKVKVDHKEIIKGVSLTIKSGETHALMGPNGSGKSTLALGLIGHPRYKITAGKVSFNSKNIINSSPEERAKMGLFLSFQYPSEIAGVNFLNFLRTAFNSLKRTQKNPIAPVEFRKYVQEKLKILKMNPSFLKRSVNEGFSGGEKKKAEILQLAVLEPKIAVLDETDSGLDIDALKIVAKGINELQKKSKMGILLITHYQRILEYIKPDFVHVMKDGQIVKSGTQKLAEQLEKKGYAGISSRK